MTNEEVYLKLVRISNIDLSTYISSENRCIYHYTSPQGLNGILSNHTLRFTDRNFLNDYSEGRNVMQLCLKSRFELHLPKEYRKYFKECCQLLFDNPSKKKRHIYQCSFSTQEDNLSLWNYYTKSDGIKGYNVGFNSFDLSKSLVTRDYSEKRGIRIFHGNVVYSVANQKKTIKNIVKDFNDIIEENKSDCEFCKLAIQLLVEKILFVGSFFKNPHFKNENEYRLLLHLMSYWDPDEKLAKFYVLEKRAYTYEKNGLLIPFIDIEFPRDILKTIFISPTLKFDETESNLKNALRIHSYNPDQINIRKSDIPVRY